MTLRAHFSIQGLSLPELWYENHMRLSNQLVPYSFLPNWARLGMIWTLTEAEYCTF